ncbi:hypothetical protein GCM10022223_43120 [Kineosporia mesophila]|uniref:PH (Pleckstrin Homology) domain-containing protein n=1 Tax=Kineosporia mesophila TaxID=566012 RepID=A0ABP6ZWN5_9ACTN|nr:hypothetical protein [Kineosporia mesophila]MCD5353251.1 hypothetical protein [Kineosporia mesophila]
MSNTGGYSAVPGEQEDPPADWPKPHRSIGRIGSVVLFALLAILFAILTVDEVLHGTLWQVLVWAGGMLLLVHLTGLTVSLMHRPRQASGPPSRGTNDQGEEGLAFPYSRWAYYWLSVVLGACAIGCFGYAVAAVRQVSVAGVVMSLVFASFGLYLLWFLVTMLRTAPGVVVITSAGIYHRSLTFEHFVPWESVTEVAARNHQTPWITVKAFPLEGTRTKNNAGRFSKGAEGLPFMIIRAYWLGANAVPAYLAVRQYFYSPEQRAELAGQK